MPTAAGSAPVGGLRGRRPAGVASFPLLLDLDVCALGASHIQEDEEPESSGIAASAPASARSGGVFRRLARKLGSCRRLLGVKFDGSGAPHEVPFFRRSRGAKSPRGSESNRGWAPDMSKSTNSRRQGLCRLESTSFSESTTQDIMSSHADSSTKGGGRPSADSFVYTGNLAIDCLPHDTTEPINDEIKEVITELHLLQFGMMIGESSAELAIGMQGAAPPVGPSEGSLYGPVDTPEQYAKGWDAIIEEHKEGLHYWVSRRHLRKGLFMYKSRTVYERATPQQMVAFTFADVETRRSLWDDSATALEPLPAPGHPRAAVAPGTPASSFMYARTRFPPPMSQREYLYARRVWYKADDGGCYCISRACHHPAPPEPGCRTTRVLDFAAGFVIRAVPGIYSPEPAVEVSTVYFEDSRAHAGIINMGIRKAMWPMTQKSEKGLRKYIALHPTLPFRRSPPFSHPPAPPSVPASSSSSSEASAAVAPAPRDVPTPTPMPASAAASPFAAVQSAAPPAPTPAAEPAGSASVTGTELALVLPAAPEAGASVPAGTWQASGGAALRNAAMFSGYYPALTRRLHITPILYAGYAGAWRYAAMAVRALGRSTVLSVTLFWRWHRSALAWLHECVLARLLPRRGHAGAKGQAGSPVRSFPLQIGGGQGQAVASGGGRAGGMQRRQQAGFGRRWAQLASMTAKAVVLPLMHGLLNGRNSSSGRDAGAGAATSAPLAALRMQRGGAAASADGASSSPRGSGARGGGQPLRPRPVVVDGVVVGHCLRKPRVQHQARTLLQVMWGLGQEDAGRKDGGAAGHHPPRAPLSRRVM